MLVRATVLGRPWWCGVQFKNLIGFKFMLKMRRIVLCVAVLLLTACSQQSAILNQVSDYRSVEDRMRDCGDGFLREEIGVPPIDSFRTKAKSEVSHSGKSVALDSIIIFERPDMARIEFFKPGINQIDSIITIFRGKITAYSTSRKTAYQGKANHVNIYRLFGIPLSEAELMSWFVGRLLIGEGAKLLDVKQSSGKDGSMYLLYDLRDGRKARILLDGAQAECNYPEFRLREVEILAGKGDKPLFHTVYEYRENSVVPAVINFKINEANVSGRIMIDPDNEVNVSLKTQLFKFSVPDGAKVKSISEMDEREMLFSL